MQHLKALKERTRVFAWCGALYNQWFVFSEELLDKYQLDISVCILTKVKVILSLCAGFLQP